MIAIEFFAGTQKITKAFNNKLGGCKSLDFVQLKNERKIDFLMDFLEFDYQACNPAQIKFLYFGFPCNTFSIASGGLHWEKDKFKTMESVAAYLMFLRMAEIINYFSKAVFYIENPSGAICSKEFFKNWCKESGFYIYTISQLSFGYPTQKKTNIITNSKALIVSPNTYKSKGRYQKVKLENLSLKNRQAYTEAYADFIIDNFLNSINS